MSHTSLICVKRKRQHDVKLYAGYSELATMGTPNELTINERRCCRTEIVIIFYLNLKSLFKNSSHAQ
jgi:hypothetical protein